MQATMPNNQPTFICLRTAIMSWNRCNIDGKLKTKVYLIWSLMNEIFTQGLISSIDCFALPRWQSLHHRCLSAKSSTWLLISIQLILAIKYTVVFLTLLFYTSFSFFPVDWKVYFGNFGIPTPLAYPDSQNSISGTGGVTQQIFIWGGSAPSSNPLHIPFFHQKIPLPYTFYWQMVACSAGLFRVGESLFMFAIVVATIFDLWPRKIGENTERGCLPFTKIFWEIWLENKWNKTLGFPNGKFQGATGTSEKVVLFFWMEDSKRKFVFHSLKAFFDTSFRPSRPFFSKCNWFVQMVKAILGRNLSVLNFANHLPTPWTKWFVHVNGKQPVTLRFPPLFRSFNMALSRTITFVLLRKTPAVRATQMVPLLHTLLRTLYPF